MSRRKFPRAASKFVRKEFEKHPEKTRTQNIAVGLSRAREAGVRIPKRSSRRSRSSNPHASLPSSINEIMRQIFKGIKQGFGGHAR